MKRLAGRTAELGVFRSFNQMAPTEVYTYSHPYLPYHPYPETHWPQGVPEVANSGSKDFTKMAFLFQRGQKEQQPGS